MGEMSYLYRATSEEIKEIIKSVKEGREEKEVKGFVDKVLQEAFEEGFRIGQKLLERRRCTDVGD